MIGDNYGRIWLSAWTLAGSLAVSGCDDSGDNPEGAAGSGGLTELAGGAGSNGMTSGGTGDISSGGAPSGGGASAGTTHGGQGGAGSGGRPGYVPPPERDLSCSSDAECCAVLDGCYAQLWLVTIAQKASIESYIASWERTGCFACIPPAVQVRCDAGRCVGEEVAAGYQDIGSQSLRNTHCGPVLAEGVAGSGGAPRVAFKVASPGGAGSAAAGAPTKFGCGSL